MYESFKGLIGAIDDAEPHIGFGDDPCGFCGEQDGEFYYFVPATAVEEVA